MEWLSSDFLRNAARVFNYVEVALWPTMGVMLLWAATRRTGSSRRDCLLGGVILLIFGASDFFEAQTGNEWWRPWWLFLWKAGCVTALVMLLISAWHRGVSKKR